MLEVSRERVRQLIHDGRLAARKYGAHWRVSLRSVVRMLGHRGGRLAMMTVDEVAARWGFPRERVREAVRDGWLRTVGRVWIPIADVEDIERMGMLARFKRRVARGEPLTPVVYQSVCGVPEPR
jgi:excisionase family DNA binding protein